MNLKTFRHFKLFKPGTRYKCRECACAYATPGDTWLLVNPPTKAVDGTNAYRIYWFCHHGHKTMRGYSRPVSHKKNFGGDMVVDDGKSFGEEEAEIEFDWKEAIEYATRMSKGGSEKKYL